jgi:osmotically-inducible protein OsmY
MRHVARALLFTVLIVLVAFFAFSYLNGTPNWHFPGMNPTGGAVGTTGAINTEKARQTGAEVGEKVGIAAAKVGQAVDEATLTSKIKAKMVLDDSIKARAIDVTTNGSIVTLTGAVGSSTEHDRAIALARETTGVTHVVDRLVIQR